MNHHTTADFWDCYARLPEDVEDLAETIEAGMAAFNPGWKPDKEFRRFLRYVTERRVTKAGAVLAGAFQDWGEL